MSAASHDRLKKPPPSESFLLGAHVSSQGGPKTAVENCLAIHGSAFALFLKNQRRWKSPPLDEAVVREFKAACAGLAFDVKRCVLPHGSYLVNLGSPDPEIRTKSFDCFLDEVQRCEALGLGLLNIHPGSTRGEIQPEESSKFIADSINQVMQLVPSVIIVLENTAGGGGSLGRTFEELAMIIEQIHDQSRIGVCLDTCHLFAAGYDISTRSGFDETMAQFEQKVGFAYLRAMHLNDCKSALGSRLDRHELLGKGKIGLACFEFIMNDSRFQSIPLILETPGGNEIWQQEIKLLQSFTRKS